MKSGDNRRVISRLIHVMPAGRPGSDHEPLATLGFMASMCTHSLRSGSWHAHAPLSPFGGMASLGNVCSRADIRHFSCKSQGGFLPGSGETACMSHDIGSSRG